MLAWLSPLAVAATLPGVPLPFDLAADGRWTLGADLPAPLVEAGVRPGWALVAVDDLVLADAEAVRRVVAAGPARELRLRFLLPDPPKGGPAETIVVVRRAELVHVERIETLPWPDGFRAPAAGWRRDARGEVVLADADGDHFALDPLRPSSGTDAAAVAVPELWFTLSRAAWVIDRDGVATGTSSWAAGELAGAWRVAGLEGRGGDHLLLPGAGGLEVLAVDWPRGTPSLPVCVPSAPETCLASGRQIAAELADRPGALQLAREELGIACARGVQRACFEAVALDDPGLAERVAACTGGDAAACTDVARQRLDLEPERPPDLVLGMLDHACELEGAGTLGERLRRLEEVGAGCMLLARATDARGLADRALLALDQACVLGRADACATAAERRHQAFAARIVRECTDEAVPIAPSCVELGRLLQAGPVASTALDDFGAFLRGCSLGASTGCEALADYVDRWGIENPRVRQAEADLAQACAGGEPKACLGAGHLYVRHDPRSEAYGEALVLFDGACDAGLGAACVAGAEQRRIGQARKVAAPGQTEMWTAACDRHDPRGCLGLGERLARERDGAVLAFDAWLRACDLGEATGCSELGPLVARPHEPAWPGEEPPSAYLARGCDRGDPQGCYWLARETLPPKGEPPEPTYLLLERACSGEHGEGCASLATVHLDRRTSFDDEIAARHLDTACANGHYDSCRVLGGMYLRGQGVDRDRQRANELLDRFRLNARRRYVRVGVLAGVAAVVGGEGELVVPIPVGPALSVAGNFSYLPGLGSVLVLLDGDDSPREAPDLQVVGASARIYPNHQARGIYGAVGFQQVTALGGSLANPRTRLGWSARLGIRNDSRGLYSGVELGLGQFGIVDVRDFDEDKHGLIPLVVPYLGVSFGLAPL